MGSCWQDTVGLLSIVCCLLSRVWSLCQYHWCVLRYHSIDYYNIDTVDANTVVDCTRASWASRGTAVAVAWLCPAQIWTYLDVIFWHGIDHAPTNNQNACLFVVLLRDTTDTTIRKHAKNDHNLSENKKGQEARQAFDLCAYAVQTRGKKIPIEFRKIERSVALVPLVLITTCLKYRNRFLVIFLGGGRIAQLNWYRLSPCVFRTVVVVVVVVVVFTLNRSFYPTTSAVPPVSFLILHPREILSTPNFTLFGRNDFWSCHTSGL